MKKFYRGINEIEYYAVTEDFLQEKLNDKWCQGIVLNKIENGTMYFEETRWD